MESRYINTRWHVHSNWTYKSITGTLTAEYSGMRLNVSFSGSTFSNYKMEGSGYPDTGNMDTIRIFIDGREVASTKVSMFSSNSNVSCSGYLDITATSHNVVMTIQCGDNKACPYNYYNYPCTLGNIAMPSPYVAPSVSCSALTEISRIDDGSWSVTYNVTPPTGANISDVGLDVIRNVNGTDTVLEIFSFGAASGNRTNSFTIHSGNHRTDGSSFNTRIYVNDSHGSSVHSAPWKLTRTYRIPTVSNVKISRTSFSPQDNATLNWTTNSRTWTNHESNFSTKIVCGKNSVDATNQGPTNTSNDGSTFTASCTETLNKTFLSKITSAAEQSVSVMTKNVEVHRINSSGNYNISSNTNIVVQYQPVKAPLNGTVKDSSGNSVAGKTIIIQDIPTIDLDWTYPITAGAAGVVDGYVLRIYKDSKYSQQVGNAKIVNVTQNASSGTCELNTKSDLSRGVMNYVKITPFYTKPDGTGRIEGTQSLQMRLVLPISRINTPVIS